jgi:chromosome segregation ATPase
VKLVKSLHELQTEHDRLQELEQELTVEEQECDRLQKELDAEREKRAKIEASLAAETARKEEMYAQMVREQQKMVKMESMHMEMSKECSQAEARATALVMQIDQLEMTLGSERRARQEAEKRCTATMEVLKSMSKEDIKEVSNHTPIAYRIQVTDRDGNGAMRQLSLVPEGS